MENNKAKIEELNKEKQNISNSIEEDKKMAQVLIDKQERIEKNTNESKEDNNNLDYDVERATKEAIARVNSSIKEKVDEIRKDNVEADNKEAKQSEVKKDIEAEHDKKEEEENEKILNQKLGQAGLREDDFKNVSDWKNLSAGEKMFVIEQASQDTLSRVKEIGEKRFQEKNRISGNPKTWGKIFKHMTKSVWISKEEKSVIEDVKNSRIKPDEEKLNQLAERTADMKLDVIVKDGKASIDFANIDKNLPKEQQEVIEKYNKIANEFAHMPDSWKNERAAASKKSKLFNKNKSENFDKYKNLEIQYKEARNALIEIKVKQYESNTMIQVLDGVYEDHSKIVKEKTLLEVTKIDHKIEMLQFTNTNPDAVEELKKIENESSWGRLVNNETIWRGLYMGIGYGARKGLTYSFGLLAAPIVAGTIGGIRAREKAKQKINIAFSEGRGEETFRERKEAGKKGIADNKNANTGIFSKAFSGQKVNTKEVAAFVDADSQIQRLNNLMNKFNKTNSGIDKNRLVSEIFARIDFIEQKHKEGLINYGNKKALGKNYELLKLLSEIQTTIPSLIREMEKDILKNNENIPYDVLVEESSRRQDLLEKIMEDNEVKLGSKQALIKNQEMLRGMAISAGFATLGFYIRHFMHGTPSIDTSVHTNTINGNIENGHLIKNIDTTQANKPLDEAIMKKYFPNTEINEPIHHANIEVTASHGHGAINTLKELQNNLRSEYPDISKAPVSVQHILNTDSTKLAEEYGMYKPGAGAESAIIKAGSIFRVDEQGNVTYHEAGVKNPTILEKGTEAKASDIYHGKIFDSDHSEIKTTSEQPIKEVKELDSSKLEREKSIVSADNENIKTNAKEEIKSVPFVQQKQLDTAELSRKAQEAITKEQVISHFDHVSEGVKGTYAEDLMKVNDDPTEQNEVGRELIKLRDNIQARTGTLVNPKPNEDLSSYLDRLMDAFHENRNTPTLERIEPIPAHVEVMDTHTTENENATQPNAEHVNETTNRNTPTLERIEPKPAQVEVRDVSSTENGNTNINSSDITPEALEQIYIKDITHLFPTEKLMNEWNNIKTNISAENFMDIGENGGLKKDYVPLFEYMNKLEEVTGLHPQGTSIINPDPESIPSFIDRAIKEAIKNGKIKEIEL
jgi:hypothetical protein